MIKQLHPLKWYNKYLGKPFYQFSRRNISKSKILALGMADLPASIITGGIVGLIFQDFTYGIYASVGHQSFMIPHLYLRHNYNRYVNKSEKEIKEKIQDLENRFKELNLYLKKS